MVMTNACICHILHYLFTVRLLFPFLTETKKQNTTCIALNKFVEII